MGLLRCKMGKDITTIKESLTFIDKVLSKLQLKFDDKDTNLEDILLKLYDTGFRVSKIKDSEGLAIVEKEMARQLTNILSEILQ